MEVKESQMRTGEMSLLGIAIRKEDKKDLRKNLYVEYHRCDRCGAEYRVYLHSQKEVEEADQAFAKMFGNKPEEQDLCYNCQSQVIFDQPMLPLGV